MFSKILIKLIDQSIVPAILLITTRVLAIILYSNANHILFLFDKHGFYFTDVTHYINVNSFSSLAIIIVLAIGLTFIMIKAYVFHDSHITPKMTTEIFATRMHGLIQTSYELYTQGTIWLSYLFFMTLASGLMVYFGIAHTYVFIVGLLTCVFMTVLLILDIENELKINANPFRPEEDANE